MFLLFNLYTQNYGQRWSEELSRRAGGLSEGGRGRLSVKSKQSKFCCVEQGHAATHVGLPYGDFLKSEESFFAPKVTRK